MFRVVFFVDDRKLGDALRGLLGLAHGAPEVQPVTNVRKKGNGLAAVSNGSAVEQFMAHLHKHKVSSFGAEDAREFIKGIGMSPTSYSYLLAKAKAAGAIKMLPKKKGRGSGNGRTYQVISK